jgi:Reverse transcriptase (RNA-dependent DNA polymerase)
MILFTGAQIQEIREVFQDSVWAMARRDVPVLIEAGAKGILVTSQDRDVAVGWKTPGSYPECRIALPASVFRNFAWWGSGVAPGGTIPPGDFPAFPDLPRLQSTLTSGQLAALHEAMRTADVQHPVWSRVELRGNGTVSASDGQQVLLQTGFPFPWNEDLRVSPTLVFGNSRFQGLSAQIGRSDSHVVVQTGEWTVALPIREASFPRLEATLPTTSETLCWRFSEENVAELERRLTTERPDADIPLWLSLDEWDFVTGLAIGTELARVKVPWRHPAFTVSPSIPWTSRGCFLRALQLGFREFSVSLSNGLIQCRDGSRISSWAPWQSGPVLPTPAKDITPNATGFPREAVLGRHPLTGCVSVFVVRQDQRYEETAAYAHFLRTCGLLEVDQQLQEIHRAAEEQGITSGVFQSRYLAWLASCTRFETGKDTDSLEASNSEFPDVPVLDHSPYQPGYLAGLRVQQSSIPPAPTPLQTPLPPRPRRRRLTPEEAAWRKENDIVFLGRGVSFRLSHRVSDSDRLTAAGLPVLATPLELAQAMGLTISQLRWLTYHTDATTRVHYVSFTVPKKGGGERVLHAPLHLMGRAQRWVLENILAKLPVEEPCHGFRPGHSTVTNAAAHAGRAVVVNMDLSAFFPSIGFRRVLHVFESLGYSGAVSTLLTLLCTDAPRREEIVAGKRRFLATGPRGLPQGACTSPALSNQVVRRLDRRLAGLGRRFGAVYTRYADDLSFSGSEELLPLLGTMMNRVRAIIRDEGFAVNEAKTRVQRQHACQKVTGLVVNDRPGVVRHEVRRLRAILHRARTEGLAAQNRDGHPNFLAWLNGKIGYVLMARPETGAKLQAELKALLAGTIPETMPETEETEMVPAAEGEAS